MKKKIICSIVFVLVMQHFAFAKANDKEKFLTRGQLVQMGYDFLSSLPNFKYSEHAVAVHYDNIPQYHPLYKSLCYIAGVVDTCISFGPRNFPIEKPVSRLEFVMSVYTMFELIERDEQVKFPYSAETLMKFSDLPDDKNVCNAVLEVADMGIIEGYPSKSKKTGDYNDPEMKKPMPLSEAKKYFAIIKSTTEKLLKEKGLTLKDPAK